MKYLCHVPIEQYGFISVEVEGEPHDAVAAYDSIKRATQNGDGLSARAFCSFIDTFLSTGSPPENGLDLWQDMNQEQKVVVNEVKKAFARMKRR